MLMIALTLHTLMSNVHCNAVFLTLHTYFHINRVDNIAAKVGWLWLLNTGTSGQERVDARGIITIGGGKKIIHKCPVTETQGLWQQKRDTPMPRRRQFVF